jgi:hypothetical protein
MKDINIIEELNKNQIILVLLPKQEFSEKVLYLAGKISKGAKKCGFLSLLNPYSTLLEKFKTNKINSEKFFFIDVLTSAIQKTSDLSNCTFIDSPSNLTKLSIVYSDLIKIIGIDYAILDSLQKFLVYRDKSTVIQFIQNLITKSRLDKVKLLFIATKEEGKDGLLEDLSTCVDKTIDLNEK